MIIIQINELITNKLTCKMHFKLFNEVLIMLSLFNVIVNLATASHSLDPGSDELLETILETDSRDGNDEIVKGPNEDLIIDEFPSALNEGKIEVRQDVRIEEEKFTGRFLVGDKIRQDGMLTNEERLSRGSAGFGPNAELLTPAEEVSCSISELMCDTGQCISIDKYCDGVDDCGDKSDEPRYCTPCNRTYYGVVGRTYELQVRRPREEHLPFLCALNFTAAGGEHGDIIQLTFDTFTVGKFVSFTSDGCPDGHMSIRERAPSPPLGQWCGSAWGYTVYFSESDSINLTLRLDRLSQQGIGYNFEFKLAFKFLRRVEARMRYGGSGVSGAWRGARVPGTYCDRALSSCDTRPCRIQSPNFPGVYPRNATCTYKIEHNKIPPGKHAMLVVRQTNSHKIHIKDQIVKYDRSQRVLKLWDQCNVVQDYLTVWDGGSRSSPVLARLCGGDAVPDIVSRGPTMLLEFHTSPYDNPFHPVPLSYLPGFELEVQVVYVDADSHSYIRGDDGRCEFTLSAYDAAAGELRNPRHSLPPNTTCTYRFQGRPNEIVWISFVKYHGGGGEPAAFDQQRDCSARLALWDGTPPASMHQHEGNGSLLGEFCREDAPRLCDHALLSNATRRTRPCAPAESYVTAGSELTMQLELRQGSALYPVTFQLRYEFVDISQQGQPIQGSHNACDRSFTSGVQPSSGRFQSPKSIFYYGRGGSQNMSCVLRFEANRGERVWLAFTKSTFGNKRCSTHKDLKTGRWRCDRTFVRNYRNSSGGTSGFAEITITEYPWPGVALQRDCICTNKTEPLIIHTLTAPVVEINFTITMMNITEDFDDFGFEGEYRFVPISSSDDGVCSSSWGEKRLSGSSGEIRLRNPRIDNSVGSEIISDTNVISESVRSDAAAENCVHQPWLIEPEDPNSSYVYLKVRGHDVSQNPTFCPTTNRVMVYYAMDTENPREICPSPGEGYADESEAQVVEFFSPGWRENGEGFNPELMLLAHAKSFVVEFVQREPGVYSVTWIEVTKRIMFSLSNTQSSMAPNALLTMDCPYRCPELNACIAAELWCDGTKHCPSAFDEDDSNCAYHFGLPLPLLHLALAAIAALLALAALVLCIRCCRRRIKEKSKFKAQLDGTANVNNHTHFNHLHSNGTEKPRYQMPTPDVRLPSDQHKYATIQKYATIDKYGLSQKYGTVERYGMNDARYHHAGPDSKINTRSVEKFGRETIQEPRYSTLGRYGAHERHDLQHDQRCDTRHDVRHERHGGSTKRSFVPTPEDAADAAAPGPGMDGKDSFC